MILSRLDLEAIAAAITKDFFQSYYGDEVENPNRFVLVTPMNALAKDYLGLSVSYAPLSPDGSICGRTAGRRSRTGRQLRGRESGRRRRNADLYPCLRCSGKSGCLCFCGGQPCL